jgi:RNA recognition motif-containing protein
MPKTLYVGNLPWSINEVELKGKFSEITDVLEVRLITDKFSGKSKGFGFVEVPDEDVEKVIKEMNGYNWADREITVNEARPKKP